MTIELRVDEYSSYAGIEVTCDVDNEVNVRIDAMDGNVELARRAADSAVRVIRSRGKEQA